MAPPSCPQDASQMQPSTSREARTDRFVRPLGSARRTTRSRTPTPANPHPGEVYSSDNAKHMMHGTAHQHLSMKPSLNAMQTRSTSKIPSIDARPRNSSSSSSSSSSSPHGRARPSHSSHSQSQLPAEKRPWFPYPSPAKEVNSKTRSPSTRRTSNISTDSASSNSISSASSYNSEDINTRINQSRRAQSAEPSQSNSVSSKHWRGRLPTRADKDAIISTVSDVQAADINDPTSSSSDDEKERAHFKSVLKAIDAYLSHSLAANNARRRSFYSLPRSHRLLLSSLGSTIPGPLLEVDPTEEKDTLSLLVAGRGFKARLDEVDDRIRRNADVLNQILEDSRGFLGEDEDAERALEAHRDEPSSHSHESSTTMMSTELHGQASNLEAKDAERTKSLEDGKSSTRSNDRSTSRADQTSSKERPVHARVPDRDLDKVRSTIKQFVRDWSLEGSAEREAAYDPILEALEEAFKNVSSAQRTQLRVLVPGAGLGRLAFEIAWLGFSCQGNEFSFYMLLASHFILNKTARIKQHTIYPFIHSSSNWRNASDMLRPIQIPDINPSDLPSHVDFSMVAGEFIEVYSKEQEKEAWNAVATCFFIDTAHNLTRYLEVINQILVMGGVWINVGPLLWHYEGAISGDLSIELTLDEVLNLIELMGFSIESRRTLEPQCYTGNQDSMLMYRYSPEFWVARKVRSVTPAKVI